MIKFATKFRLTLKHAGVSPRRSLQRTLSIFLMNVDSFGKGGKKGKGQGKKGKRDGKGKKGKGQTQRQNQSRNPNPNKAQLVESPPEYRMLDEPQEPLGLLRKPSQRWQGKTKKQHGHWSRLLGATRTSCSCGTTAATGSHEHSRPFEKPGRHRIWIEKVG